ncbi:Fur family transcriptional regulator [Variovorax sp. GB1P17]|uniref:Fur family transcriptional regulator n=1 Tax=Variovorax sp. GB1P17 TaxID=3443740 RepID=UPI003F474FB0
MNIPDTSAAQAVLGSVGLRCTAASRAVLCVFDQEGEVLLTHAEIDGFLRRSQVEISRVTLYRLLDRFVDAGLLVRVVDQERMTRYGRERMASDSVVHPRFECRHCHRLYQLSGLPQALSAALQQAFAQWGAQGHQGLQADVAVRGVCARCVAH